jgi:hypothetical protein
MPTAEVPGDTAGPVDGESRRAEIERLLTACRTIRAELAVFEARLAEQRDNPSAASPLGPCVVILGLTYGPPSTGDASTGNRSPYRAFEALRRRGRPWRGSTNFILGQAGSDG